MNNIIQISTLNIFFLYCGFLWGWDSNLHIFCFGVQENFHAKICCVHAGVDPETFELGRRAIFLTGPENLVTRNKAKLVRADHTKTVGEKITVT